MITADELCSKYPEVLHPSALKDVPKGWLGIVERYFEVVAPVMEGAGYELVTAKELHGGIDWTWTSPMSSLTEAMHNATIREDVLLELRSYHTCRECGRPASGWKSGRRVITACESHGVGERLAEQQASIVRSLPDGFVRYDVDADALIAVEHPAGDD